MPAGTIKKMMLERGFGIIIPEGSGEDVFFHFSVLKEAIPGDLQVGDQVVYEYKVEPKGPRTTVVRNSP